MTARLQAAPQYRTAPPETNTCQSFYSPCVLLCCCRHRRLLLSHFYRSADRFKPTLAPPPNPNPRSVIWPLLVHRFPGKHSFDFHVKSIGLLVHGRYLIRTGGLSLCLSKQS